MIGTFYNKHHKWKFIFFLKQPSKAGNKVFLIVNLRSLFRTRFQTINLHL